MYVKLFWKGFFVPYLFLANHSIAQITVHSENFDTGIGTWSSVDVTDATDVWTATSGYMEMNGFGGTDDIDWLISPAIDMDAQTGEYFLFDYNDDFSGGLIELLYSTDYNNGGTPADISAATWTSIPLDVIDIDNLTCFSTLFQRHPAIDIDMISGSSVYFAFRYTGTSASSKRYQIDNVHIESDYYGNITPGINCAPLKTELSNLIATQTDRIRYTSSLYDVWDAILHTDTRLNDAGTATIVWDMFTDFPSTTGEFEFDHCADRDAGSCAAGEGNCYNREHTFPRSWWGGGTTLSDTINTDMHHVYPSDRTLNTAKNNYPPGDVLVASTTGSNGFLMGANAGYPCTPATGSKRYFEPIDEYKGDYARTFFYIATRYEHNLTTWAPLNSQGACFMDGATYPGIQAWALQVLLQWHTDDPVSQKEIDRNNAVYAIQGNRNPFIDEPNYVYLVWGDHNGAPCSTVVLPVELLAFEAKVKNDQVDLSWRTASETSNAYFLVQKSYDLIHWTDIDWVEGAGNSQSLTEYHSVDRNLEKDHMHYRLKQVDFDGNYSYSKIETVLIDKSQAISIYPNPVSDVLYINGDIDELGSFKLTDVSGRDLSNKISITSSSDDQIQMDLSSLESNIYILLGDSFTCKIIKR